METTLMRVYAAAQRGEHVDLFVSCGSESAPLGLNAAIVAAECGYFRSMIASRVGAHNGAARLECDPGIFSVVVRCIYTGAVDPGIDVEIALGVLDLAVFLDCDIAQRLVTRHIEKSGWCFEPDTAVRVWERASRVCARDARRLSASHLAGAMPRAAHAPAFLAMQKDELVELLSSDEFSARSEASVADALCAWCKANDEQCTSIDSRVVRLAWRDPAPRDRSTLHGILVLPVESTRFHLLTAGHEWVYRAVPDLRSPRGTGSAVWHVPPSACYAFGGTRGACSVDRHIGTDRRWTMHEYHTGSRPQVSCAAVGSRVYVVGGVSGMRPCEDVDVFDVLSGLKGRILMSRARRMCIVAETNGSLLVAGGFDSTCSALAHAEMLEPPSSAPAMLEPRAAAACATICSDVYVAGGIGALHEPVRTCECYHAALQRWTELPPMPRSRSYCAGASIGRYFYVIGGVERGQPTSSFFRLDIDASTWSEHDAPELGECTATRYSCGDVP
jgi:hypothetical protein